MNLAEHKEWFSSRKWGMFNHFINLFGADWRGNGIMPKNFNERVNKFDVKNYAKVASELNVGYVFFTTMQCCRYLCAPNDTFNQITGLKNGEGCSERDLIAELISELDKYNIPLFLYFTGDGPCQDKEIGKKMGYITEYGNVSETFVKNWSSVLKEYALRYGDKVHGWWVDGCYERIGYTKENKLLKYYNDAAKAGNPISLMAFNNGVVQPDIDNPKYNKFYDGTEKTKTDKINALWKLIQEGNKEPLEAFKNIPGGTLKYSEYEDYMANESNELEEECSQKYIDGSLWHKLGFLGIPTYVDEVWGEAAWDMPGCKYSSDYMYNYIKKVNEKGGVVSIDTCLFDDGNIDFGQYEVLKKLSTLR